MGACLESIIHARQVLLREANAVSDNPLVFAEEKTILSGGNFHAEPVGLVADQLSMATYAARRLTPMNQNTACIIAIELLAAAQGLDFRLPLKTSSRLQETHAAVRKLASTYVVDRAFDTEIEAVKTYLLNRDWIQF